MIYMGIRAQSKIIIFVARILSTAIDGSLHTELIMTLNCAHKLSAFLLFLTLLPLSAMSDQPQCASPSQHEGEDYYELNQRIEDPYIPNTGDISKAVPAFDELSDIKLLADDTDAMKQFACKPEPCTPTPPSEVTPLIMLHPNTDGHMLSTIEIAAISSSDCVPGLIENSGEYVLCSETSIGDNPFKGEYVFKYYELQDGKITQIKRANFSITSETFLPIHTKSLSTDRTLLEGKKLIARGLTVDVSPEGIIPPTDKPSYVSMQYIPTEHPSTTTEKADKFIYLPFSQAALEHSSASPNDSDYLQFTINGNLASQKVFNPDSTSPIAHFAARYTLAPTNTMELIEISSCNELQELSGTNHTHIRLTDDIDCGEFWPFIPLQIDHPFIFNGNGKTIKNLKVNTTASNAGLFATIPHGSNISNLSIRDGKVDGRINVGTLAGSVSGSNPENDTVIKNVHITTTNYSTFNNDCRFAGGLIGLATGNTTITNSSANIWITTRAESVGGLVGRMSGGKILRSSASGYIQASPATGQLVPLYNAGLVGHTSSSTIQESHYSGLVETGCDNNHSSYGGGLVAYASNNSQIMNSYATADVRAGFACGRLPVTMYSGGIAAVLTQGSQIDQTYTWGLTEGPDYTAGIAAYVSNSSTVKNSFTTGSVRAIQRDSNAVSSVASIVGTLTNSTIDHCLVAGDYSYFTHKERVCSGDTCVIEGDPNVILEFGPCAANSESNSSIWNCGPEYDRFTISTLVNSWDSGIWDTSENIRSPQLKNTPGQD